MLRLRLAAAVAAFLLLTGFSEQDALDRFSGGWQMDDRVFGTGGAMQIDGQARTIRVAASLLIEGKIDRVDIVGASAVFRVGGNVVIVYPGADQNTIGVQVGEVNAVMRYVRVP